LANRYLLRDRFEHVAAQAQRHGCIHTLTLLDLDGFKQVNDRFGHAAGDEVLTFLGARLMDLVRGEDTVARLGGDEFVLLLMDADPHSSGLVLRRLGESLASFSPSGLGPLGLSCSAGVAFFPVDGMTLERLLEAADKRLYAAKAGRAQLLGNGLTVAGRSDAPRWLEESTARG
jgi:diguanylate cyclase (GGDEF)-like protein